MGFDTYLSVGGSIVLMWRKHASILPRLLFRHDQLTLGQVVDEDDGRQHVTVGYTTNVSDALANLAIGGLGWEATVAAYQEIRDRSGFAVGAYMGKLIFDKVEKHDLERHMQAFRDSNPELDLVNLGSLMASQWHADPSQDVLLLSDLSYDGDLPQPHDAAFAALEAAERAQVLDPFAAARAAETLSMLDRSAPLLVWPMIMCTFLKALPDEIVITYDLSEDAQQHEDDSDFSPSAYATKYWQSATESIAAEGRLMGRLFAVLSAYNGNLGREYWFARASHLLARVNQSRRHETQLSHQRKGEALEGLVEALLSTESPELRLIEKNYRTANEEIDLVVSNSLQDPFWMAYSSPLILIECKNWSKRVGVAELRVFETKMRDRGGLCRLGIFISMSGFTKPFLDRLASFQAAHGMIFAVNGDQIQAIIVSKTRMTEWLRSFGFIPSRSWDKKQP